MRKLRSVYAVSGGLSMLFLGSGNLAWAQEAPAAPTEAPQAPPQPSPAGNSQQQQYPQQPNSQQPYPQQYPQHPYPQQPPGYPPYAQVAYGPPPGYHQHDGFFFRGTLGFGRGQTKVADLKMSGTAMGLTVAFGGALKPNLVLYGELSSVSLINPTFRQGGFSEKSRNILVSTSGIGIGLAYYVMPTNLYVSGTLLFTQASISDTSDDDDDDTLGESELGFGLGLKVGKEWWVSHNWGLGVYGGVDFATMKDKTIDAFGDKPTVNTTAFTLGFSASYN